MDEENDWPLDELVHWPELTEMKNDELVHWPALMETDGERHTRVRN